MLTIMTEINCYDTEAPQLTINMLTIMIEINCYDTEAPQLDFFM